MPKSRAHLDSLVSPPYELLALQQVLSIEPRRRFLYASSKEVLRGHWGGLEDKGFLKVFPRHGVKGAHHVKKQLTPAENQVFFSSLVS